MSRVAAVASLVTALLLGCDADQQRSAVNAPAPMIVYSSVPPLAYFVERVGGKHVRAEHLVGPGQSPHNFEPSARQVSDLAQARVVVLVGLPFEERVRDMLAKATPAPLLVDVRAGVNLLEATCDHEHGEHAHEHAADPHIWLDPKRVRIQARTIAASLSQALPDRAADFATNLAAFDADLQQLDARIAATLEEKRGQEFFVFHPAYGYFADSYGLRQVAIETDGKEPSPRQLAELTERARAAGANVLFYPPQFPRTAVDVIAREIGATAAPLDDLSRDYLRNLEDLAQKLSGAAVRGGS